MSKKESAKFEQLAKESRPSLLGEFWSFLKYNKKWWLLPILIVMLLLGAVVLVVGTGAGPWLYTLF